MYQINESSEASGGYSLGDFIAFRCVLAVSSSRSVKTQSLSAALTVLLPASVRTVLDKWNANAVTDFPSVSITQFRNFIRKFKNSPLIPLPENVSIRVRPYNVKLKSFINKDKQLRSTNS